MSEITIRAAQLGDADVLTELALRSKAYWGYDAAFMQTCHEQGLLRVTPAMINDENAYVAEVSGQTAGVYTLAHRANDTIELDMLFIDVAFMGKGIGRALFQHACETAASRGARRLIVESDPNARTFYHAMGMRQYGERESTVLTGRWLPLMEMSLDEHKG
jgi:GNAT superfamily N-acetyltransferase